jgi:hypothetical protein
MLQRGISDGGALVGLEKANAMAGAGIGVILSRAGGLARALSGWKSTGKECGIFDGKRVVGTRQSELS